MVRFRSEIHLFSLALFSLTSADSLRLIYSYEVLSVKLIFKKSLLTLIMIAAGMATSFSYFID